nr:hypothetical protein B0A51_00680 [Rachicladosporium sp. CCFEE 5018]
MPDPIPLRVALDWTPNTLHTGLLLALSQNLYSSAFPSLAVTLISPDLSNYTTPAKQVENGTADLAIVPSESVIAYAESAKPGVKLQAVYAICQKDASAIVSTTVKSIGDLGTEGKKYGSYNARYEDSIIRALIEQDGGEGAKLGIEKDTGKGDLFERVKKGELDATWIFLPWEGVEAEMEGKELSVFSVSGVEGKGVPYGYSPVIARNAAAKEGVSEEALRAFCGATRKGYEMALAEGKGEVVLGVLEKECGEGKGRGFLERSQGSVNGYYGGEGELGSMRTERWEEWVGWLRKESLVKVEVDVGSLWTNEFLQ